MSEEKGNRFAEFVNENGLKIAPLARELGVARSTVYTFLSGDSVLTVDNVTKMRNVYGLNPAWLNGESDVMFAHPDVEVPGNEKLSGLLAQLYVRAAKEDRKLLIQIKDEIIANVFGGDQKKALEQLLNLYKDQKKRLL